jgi:hypothetical protein
MTTQHRRRWTTLAWRLLLVTPALIASIQVAAPAQVATTTVADRLPERLSDADFWALVDSVSEPGGYFRIADNFTSNEREIGQLYTMLRDRGTRGGVYLGVGPEQNFTYIAAIRPQMAFIVDIRRQAVMQHLMFKAIFEMAADRAEFISILFSRPRPQALDSTTAIQAIWEAYWPVKSDSAAFLSNFARILELLTRTHGFTFTPDETAQLKWVYDNFFGWGPVISTRGGPGGGGGGNGTTFAHLTGYSNDASGNPRSFLSSEENYAYVKGLHTRNLIVPVSGDFAGPRAIRAIGAWLQERGEVVSAFYVSNVEQYLFQEGKAVAFYDNVSTLPVNEASVFIRPYSFRRYGFSIQSLCPIGPFLDAARAGQVPSNNAALACPR